MLHRPNNAILEPAHPAIADTLCAVGREFADTAEPIYDAIVDPRVELAACFLFMLGCLLFSVVAPYLPAFGRAIAP